MYRSLDPDKTVATVERLQRRIGERFPRSSLAAVCGELAAVATATKARADWIARPNYLLRIAVAAFIVLALAMLVYSVSLLDMAVADLHAGEWLQAADAALNEIVMIGAALFFLVTVELRIKRSRALAALHELRSLAHVIDMHQLTKDPNALLRLGPRTSSSPGREMSEFELSRYLDYCAEALSLAGKIAALYAQSSRDPVVIAAVNDIESLTSSMSAKIWQKIMIVRGSLERSAEQAG